MNFTLSTILAGLVFGAAGLFFFKVGKSEARPSVLFAGLALFIYPYFIENDFLLWGIGIGITVYAYRAMKG